MGDALVLAAASGAASGARQSGFSFDPSSTLPWAVPVLLIVPFVSFLLAISSIRTRRSASAMAMFGTVVSLALTVLVAWGLTKRGSPFQASYQYINMSIAFSGPTNFQSFAIDLTMRADKLTVAALFAIEVCLIGALGWHQVMGRSEPGAARFHALITTLLFAATGVLLSQDLAEMFAFWAIGGAVTYLLLEHRWGFDEPAKRARIALALPFLTDLCLLCGISWLYARYGVQNLGALLPILHTNPGWTVRSLVVGSVLIFVGAGGRLALWPLGSWLTQTAVTAPPAAIAIVQATWSVVAIVVLYRTMPIFVASSPQLLQVCVAAAVVSAVAASLLALLGNEPRRVLVLTGSAAAAVGCAVLVNGFRTTPSPYAVAGVAAVLALAPARAGGFLALSSIVAAMRTDALSEMGDAWRRMRASSVALLLSVVLVGVSAGAAVALGVSSRSRFGLALGEAVFVIAVGGVRVFMGASFGPLRRRRAFEPDRVREAPRESLTWPFWLAAAAGAYLVASLIGGWLNFLDGQKHSAPAVGALVLWLAVALAGFAAAVGAHAINKDAAVGASSRGGTWLDRGASLAFAQVTRFLIAPVTDIARRVGDWIPAGDGALGRFSNASGQLALSAGRGPAIVLVVVLAILVALVFALLGPGVVR
jgi:NADH:ubiquinone oxidoreductase subunit 5 (subunit L)/multisubunit Na+/H+ antiporter MnhA subunit